MGKIRTVALGAALVAATAVIGSAQTTPGTPRRDTAKAGVWSKGEPRHRRGPMGPGHRRGMKRRMHGMHGMPGMHGRPGVQGRPGMAAMEFIHGLNLTQTQRTQVRAIHEKYQPQMQAIHDRARTEFEATREARQRGDTAAVRASLQRSRQNVESQLSTLHEQMFHEVRAVLTAGQRARLDSGIAERIKRLDEQKARLERLRR